MRVLVQHNTNTEQHISKYALKIQDLGTSYKMLEIEDGAFDWLRHSVQYIEPDFTMKLIKQKINLTGILACQPFILAIIGSKQNDENIYAYYNMSNGYLQKNSRLHREKPVRVISCYSSNNKILASEYITCIKLLCQKGREIGLPIMIYSNIQVDSSHFRYRSLTYKIINEFLKTLWGVLVVKVPKGDICKYYIPSQASYEFYLDYSIYLDENCCQVITKILPYLEQSVNNLRFRKVYRDMRVEHSLYDDVFYKSIPQDQEIYVVPNFGNYKMPSYYETLNIEAIPIAEDYNLLYAKKSTFDESTEQLRLEINPQYQMPILSYYFFNKMPSPPQSNYRLIEQDLIYKGADVYIGIVSVDGIDYTQTQFLDQNGQTRIACIWEQIKAGEGAFYFKETINQALESPIPGEIVPIDLETMNTIMLGIAGGYSQEMGYQGVATQAEFLVAKINPAPQIMQQIFGGMPNEKAVLMPDLLIGASKLIQIAKQHQKPLVLYLPYNSNIDTHDATFTLNNFIASIAQQPGISIVVPAGEEADKMHHYTILGREKELERLVLRVDQPNQNVIGIICQKVAVILSAILYFPGSIDIRPMELTKPIVAEMNGESTVYSNGMQINFSNGAIQLVFRIDKPRVGEWYLDLTLDTSLDSLTDLWISQYEMNPSIRLNPFDPFKTIGSLACIRVISVGAFDEESMVVLRSSGRGFSWDYQVRPRFITGARNILVPIDANEWINVSGSLVAASIITGVTAVLYSKFLQENIEPLPNTLVMDAIFLRTLKQLGGIEYPNPNQGGGIFDLNILQGLLMRPIYLRNKL